MNDVRISKFLSLVLRHKPETIGVQLDGAGWIHVDELLQACAGKSMPVSIAQLKAIVENDDKKRFEFSPDDRMIRASQGHSIEVELGYKPAIPPAELYHGTATRFLVAIEKTGLQKQGRHHVHLSVAPETAINVGSRHGKPVLLKVDAERMQRDGFKFFLSTNGVWLTDSVPVDYIEFPGI